MFLFGVTFHRSSRPSRPVISLGQCNHCYSLSVSTIAVGRNLLVARRQADRHRALTPFISLPPFFCVDFRLAHRQIATKRTLLNRLAPAILCYAMLCYGMPCLRRSTAQRSGGEGTGRFLGGGWLFILARRVSGTHLSAGCQHIYVSDYINLIAAFLDRTGHAWQPGGTLCHQCK